MLETERRFWDAHGHEALAAEDEASVGTEPALDRFGRYTLDAALPLAGRNVLELGCGGGELTLRLVDAGATVTALDGSPGMIALARQRVARHRPNSAVTFVEAAVEELPLPAAVFDVVVGKWVLHHVDLARATPQIARVLKPNGRAVFYENHDRNPLLALARSRLAGRYGIARYGTATERPLTRGDFTLLRRHFAVVQRRYPEFHCFQLLSTRALRHRAAGVSRRVDEAIWRTMPALRPLSWHVLISCRGPRP